MKIYSTAKLVRVFGAGNNNGGWGPVESETTSFPTHEVQLAVEIHDDGAGYLLYCYSADEKFYDDSWHPSIEDAKLAALENLGVALDNWQRASSSQ